MSHKWKSRFKWAEHIMRQFSAKYPAELSDKAIGRAWADLYTGRGNMYLNREQDQREAWKNYRAALNQQWYYVPTWQSILRIYLPWLVRRASQS